MPDSDVFFQGKLDLSRPTEGFLTVAKAAVAKLVEGIFTDPALLALFQQLYHSQEWSDGETIASIAATLQDYLSDYEGVIHALAFKRYARSAYWNAPVQYPCILSLWIESLA